MALVWSHPGAVATNFGQDSDKGFVVNTIYKVALKLSNWGPLKLMSSPERGAATNIYLATQADVQGLSGRFWGNQKQQRPSHRYYSATNEQAVWDYCQRVIQPFL